MMETRIVNIPMEFNKAKFREDIRREYHILKSTGVVDNIPEFAVLCLNMNPDGIQMYMSRAWLTADTLPLMGNFLEVCNALGFDPRTYFILEEV